MLVRLLVSAKTGKLTTQCPSYNADTKQGLIWKLENLEYDLFIRISMNQDRPWKPQVLASADHGTFPAFNQVYYNNEFQVKDATIRDWDVNMGLSRSLYEYRTRFCIF